jgi:hypothetical protein
MTDRAPVEVTNLDGIGGLNGGCLLSPRRSPPFPKISTHHPGSGSSAGCTFVNGPQCRMGGTLRQWKNPTYWRMTSGSSFILYDFPDKADAYDTPSSSTACTGRVDFQTYQKRSILMKRQIVFAVAILLIANLLMVPQVARAQMLAPPVQEFPANGATDVPVSTWVSWRDPNFLFDPDFHVQISRNSSFTDLLVDENLDGNTGYALPGLPKNTTFYWRVNISSDGQTSEWSPVWSFTTTNRDIAGVRTLVSPPNGSTGLPSTVTLTWTAVEGADSYWVTINNGAFDQTLVEGTSITLDFGAIRDLYGISSFSWSVRSRNPAGVSEPSETWRFTIR